VAGLLAYFLYFRQNGFNLFKNNDDVGQSNQTAVLKLGVYLNSDAKDKINYEVINKSIIGTIYPKLYEKFEIDAKDNLTIYTFGEGYYKIKNTCEVIYSNKRCVLNYQKRGQLTVSSEANLLNLDSTDSVYNLSICVGLSYDVKYFNLRNLNRTNIPPILKNDADYCYHVGNLTGLRSVFYNYTGTETTAIKLYSYLPFRTYVHNGTLQNLTLNRNY